MAEITTAMVKQLRETTSVGMMDCKKALVEANGDFDEALNILRLKGLSRDLKEGRTTNQGVVAVAYGPSRAWVKIVELNCETDFVARNKDFGKLAHQLADTYIVYDAIQYVSDTLKIASSTFGENIILKRDDILFLNSPHDHGTDSLVDYVHSNNQIGVIVSYEQPHWDEDHSELMRDIAMHIAASNPKVVDRHDVDPVLVGKEQAFLLTQPDVMTKPEAVRPKMIAGRMGKFYSKLCLLEQPFVKDPSLTVRELLKQKNLTVLKFYRYEVGEQ